MMEIATLLIRLFVAVMATLVLPTVKRWINSKTENEQLMQLKQVAETAVYAAEQLYHGADPNGEIRRKYAHRVISITANRLGLAITDREINSLIQAAVQEINLIKDGYNAEVVTNETMDT